MSSGASGPASQLQCRDTWYGLGWPWLLAVVFVVQVKFTAEVPGDPRWSQRGRMRCRHSGLNHALPWRDRSSVSVFRSGYRHTFIESLYRHRAGSLRGELGLHSPSCRPGELSGYSAWELHAPCVIGSFKVESVVTRGSAASASSSSALVQGSLSHLFPPALGLGFPMEGGWAGEGLQCPSCPGGQPPRGPDPGRHG